MVGGVVSTPSRTTNTFSPEPSARKPCSFSRMASSKPALSASILASCELRYCPEALAAAGTVFGPMRRQRRGRDAHAVGERLLAEIRTPRPDRDHDIDRAVERVDAELAIAAEGDRPDVARAHLVGRERVVRGLPQLVGRVRELHVVDLRRALEARQVLAEPEDAGAAVGLVRADALEDPRAVVQRVREDVDLRVGPVDELAVHPDLLGLLHATGPSSGERVRARRMLGRIVPG